MANVLDSNIFEVNKQQYKMIATVYDDAAYVLGLEQQDKSNEMILATENIIEFQYVNQLGKLCLDGSLTYKDTEGFVSNFLNVEYVGLDIFIAKQLQESDGSFTNQTNDENNQMKHSFMVSNIEILERHATDIIYKFHLISRQWYNFSANLDISTYALDEGALADGLIGRIKKCLNSNQNINEKKQFLIDDASFDLCNDGIKQDYITKANDNVFSAISYLLDKLFYYSKVINAMKFIVYNENENKYRMLDLSKKQTFGGALLVILSMFKTQLESMAYSSECNFGTVVRFPKTDMHKMLFQKDMATYDFNSNQLMKYTHSRANIAQTMNNSGNDNPNMLAKLNEQFLGENVTTKTNLINIESGAIWQNDFHSYEDFCDELLGDNALIISMDGILGRHPGDIAVLSIEDDLQTGDSNIANGNEAKYLDLKRRYARLKKGTWLIGKVRHIIRPLNKTFKQNIIAFQNFIPEVKV